MKDIALVYQGTTKDGDWVFNGYHLDDHKKQQHQICELTLDPYEPHNVKLAWTEEHNFNQDKSVTRVEDGRCICPRCLEEQGHVPDINIIGVEGHGTG